MTVAEGIVVRVFLSCVSNEFKAYRERLRQQLATAKVDAVVQEHFPELGKSVLELLDESVRTCDVVVHLVGRRTGSAPDPVQLAAFLDPVAHPERVDLLARCGLTPHAHSLDRVSYTQWEFWLGRAHGKTCLAYEVDSPAGTADDPAQAAEQAAHLKRISPHLVYGHADSDWQLSTRVMVSLIHGGTLAVSGDRGPPAIVIGFSPHSTGEYLASAGIRWRGESVRIADPVVVAVGRRGPKAARDVLTEFVRRGNWAFEKVDLGASRVVVELVLSRCLFSRPLSEWVIRSSGRGEVPLRERHPVRVRLEWDDVREWPMNEIRSRLKVLGRHPRQHVVVHRKCVPDECADGEDALPAAVVHESEGGWWRTLTAVCGAFHAPPPKAAARTPTRGRSTPAEVFEAIAHGVPFLLWPDAASTPDAVEAELRRSPCPTDLCAGVFTRQSPFVVFAESKDPPFPDEQDMTSDVTFPGAST